MPETDARVTIPFNCPYCGHYTEVETRFAGQSGPCVGCSNTITVPRLEQAGVTHAAAKRGPALPHGSIVKLGMAIGAVISCAVLAVVIWSLMQPALRAARDATRCAECEENLRRIGMALEDYHNEHRAYPPAVVYDKSGKPMHSWRVLILPYLGPEAQSVYEEYDQDQPWDSKQNMLLVNRMPHVYGCPADSKSVLGETSYLGVVGDETVLTRDPNVVVTRRSIHDLPSETMVVVECAGSAVNWLEPKDLPVAALRAGINSNNPTSPSSQHVQGVNVLMADQTTVRLVEGIASEDLRGMATIQGNEYIEALDELED